MQVGKKPCWGAEAKMLVILTEPAQPLGKKTTSEVHRFGHPGNIHGTAGTFDIMCELLLLCGSANEPPIPGHHHQHRAKRDVTFGTSQVGVPDPFYRQA
ncbi:UNVERIFIED_CONTAM: hypothetical protein K2H54_025791 [Gekko kuhli]